MSDTVTIETIRRVYADNTGAFIEVGPDLDSLGGLVRISINGVSEKEFGKADFILNFALAKALAEAILKSVEDLP